MDDAHLDRLRKLDTSVVSDALDRFGIAGQCVGILPLDRSMRIAGRAFTVSYVDIADSPGTVGDYIDDLRPGQVVVLANNGRDDATVWGDILTEVAVQRGIAGTVIDGACRDTDKAVALGYAVYARSRTMRTGKDRVKVAHFQTPVSVCGVTVRPGDYLLGDADGVVCIPAERIIGILQAAEQIERVEEEIRQAVRAGATLRQARQDMGYHHLQSSEAGDYS